MACSSKLRAFSWSRGFSLECVVKVVAVVAVLVGLLVVWFVADWVGPAGGVVVEGVVREVSVQGNVMRLVVVPGVAVPVIVFGDWSVPQGAQVGVDVMSLVSRGDSVRVVGRLREFRGKVDLVAEDFEVIPARLSARLVNSESENTSVIKTQKRKK